MSRRWNYAGAGLRPLVLSLVAWSGWAGGAQAQTDLPNAKAELSAEERAQKQADKVFTFIKLQSMKPIAKRAAAESPAPSPPVQAASIVVAKVTTPKPQAKAPAGGASEARQLASGAEVIGPSVESQSSLEADSQPILLAAASLTAATVQPELLPDKPAPLPEPEPPALQLLSKVEPEIPRQLQADFRGGAVTVRFTVQTDGSVMQAQALQSSHKRLAVAAVTAVNQWRFAPLPAPREATVDIAFSVE